MSTLAEHINVAGAENRPPMLEKSMYDSWASLEEDGQTRTKKYSELTEAQQLQDDCDSLLLFLIATIINPQETQQVKEETFQVVIDLIKNSSCFKAFTIFEDVLEIFMQQFWYTVKKVQGTDSYEFILANNKCIVNAEVFRTILDIYPRVEGVNFTDVPDDDTTLAFLIELGYKASNDKLRKSRIDILWGMFYRENVDYPTLIWEDLAFQIDHRKEKRLRRENMPFPRFTKIIINHFLKQHKSLSNLKYQHYHTFKDDGIVSRLKFVRIGEDYQEYGLPIFDVMLTEAIKQSESYQMFIKYSTGQIPPRKSIGKGSQGKKTTDTPVTYVDVSEESEPEPARKEKTASRRVVKKKVIISADDNIIPDPDVALELGKSISLTEAEEAEAARQVHAFHARIVIESVLEPTRRRPSEKPAKEPGVTNESIVVSATSSEGTGTKPGFLDEEKVVSEENVILEWGDEQDSKYSDDDVDKDGDTDDKSDDHISDTQDANDEDAKTESGEDEIYKYKIRVRKDKNEEMTDAEVVGSDKGDEDVTDAAKADAEKTSEVKDDAKKTELSPTSFSLLVSLGFGDQFLKTSSDNSLIVLTPVQESPLIANVTTLSPHSISATQPVPQQTTTPIPTPPITTDSPTITAVVLESDALNVVQLRVAKLEKDVSELKKIDLSAEDFASLKTQVPTVVDNYLGSKVRDIFQKELQKHTVDLIQKYSLKQAPKSSKIKILTINLEQESKKSPSEILKIKKEQAKKQKIP
ncbi:hypothetical protein Tco_0318459 [Tanacetum coccineum]